MSARPLPAVQAGLLAAGLAAAQASAHGIAGDRFFPATLTVDDPAVADELSLPTVSYLEGDAAETDISGEYSKRLTSTLGVSFGETWSRIRSARRPRAASRTWRPPPNGSS